MRRFRCLRQRCTYLLARRPVAASASAAAAATADVQIHPIGQTAYDTLILRARAGDTEPALAYLRQRGDAASLQERYDHILIASWAGRVDEVIARYQNLPLPPA